jgi:drug/metabolite transporter (DMT)-like permease
MLSSGVFVAILAALLFALADTTIRSALRFTTPTMASFLVVAVQWVIYTGLILAKVEVSALNLQGLLWFILAGLLNPVLFLTFFLIGIQRIGVARSAPIKGSAPIYAVIFAVAFLGERPEPLQYLGIGLVVAGVICISAEGGGGASGRVYRVFPHPPRPRPQGLPSEGPSWRKRGILFPLLAGLSSGISSNLFKVALGHLPSPLLGAWVGVSEGLLLFPLLAFLFPKGERFRLLPPAWPWLLLGSLSASAAVYGLFLAISLGQVSIVFTLIQTSPLFVVILSALFLRQMERVTPGVVFGAILTVGGGALVSTL